MCYNAKSSISSFLLITLISLLLWYRNEEFDRSLAVFIFAFGLIQLLEYFYYTGSDPSLVSRLIYIALWLQPLVFVLAVSHDVPDTLTNVIIVFYAILFFLAIYTAMEEDWNISVGANHHLVWERGDGESFMGEMGFFYVVGILLPLLLLIWKSGYDWTLILLLVFALGSFWWSYKNYNQTGEMGSFWCFLSVIFAVLAYLRG